MSTQWYGTTAGLTLNAVSTEPMKTPSGILVTRSVQTKDGWVGQIIVDKTIVWQSEPIAQDEDDDFGAAERNAVKEANERVVRALTDLFA